MKKLLLFLLCPAWLWGQAFLPNAYQEDYNRALRQQSRSQSLPVFGFGARLTVDFVAVESLAQLRLSLVGAAGMGVVPSGNSHALFPNYHIELDVYRGGLGSSLAPSERSRYNFELRQTLMLTAALDNGPAQAVRRPVVQFISSAGHPLADPYKTSLSLGTVFINGLNHHRHQRVGILGMAFEGLNITYYNDGPPFDKLKLGDRYDRWWTGGLLIGWYDYRNANPLPAIELKFEKFTGWEPKAYEVSKFFQLDYIPYRHFSQNFFNQGRWQLNLTSNSGVGFNVTRFDKDAWDLQHFIHLNLDMTRHPPTLKERWSIGASYDALNQTTLP